MKKLLTIAVFTTLSVVGVFAQNDRLGTTQWKLVRLVGTPVTNSSKAYLELNAPQTRFSGTRDATGCSERLRSRDAGSTFLTSGRRRWLAWIHGSATSKALSYELSRTSIGSGSIVARWSSMIATVSSLN